MNGTRTPSAAQLVVPAALLAVVIVVLLLSLGGGGVSHSIRAEFASAEQLAPGLQVRLAGRQVGDISSVRLVRGRPIVTIQITESDIWPLPAGTQATERWGSTTSLESRYIELNPGPSGGATIPNAGLIPLARTHTAVELDQIYRIFRHPTAAQTEQLVAELGDTLSGQGATVRAGLAAAPSGLNQTSAVLGELGADQAALNQLVTQGDAVSSALASRQDDLGALVTHAANTFNELATYSSQQQLALDRAPTTLSQGQTTLARLDRSLGGLQTLVGQIAPGALRLRQLAPTARTALSELEQVAPLADSVLQRGIATSQPLTSLLTSASSFVPQLGSALQQFAPMADCLLPYAPETAGALSTWSGFNENYDAGGHYARTFDLTVNPLIIAGSTLNSAQIVAATGGNLSYAMPRPPGLNAGQPWLLGQCGVTASSMNASDDPEAQG